MNLSALQSDLWPRLSHSPAGNAASGAGPLVSRRQLLGLAGVVAAGLLPGLRNIKWSARQPFRLEYDGRRAIFMLGNTARWVIDPDRFAGTPAVHAEKAGEGWSVRLSGARYPGTRLPADLTADLRPARTGGWVMDLRMALGGFAATVPLEEWLAGHVPARSAVTLDGPLCDLGGGTCVDAGGPAGAEFAPAWSFRLTGRNAGRVAGPGFGSLESDTVLLSLLTPFDPSLMRQPSARRTLVTLARGTKPWSLQPPAGDQNGWRLAASGGSPFGLLHLEAGESAGGRIRRALVAEALPGSGPSLAFYPGDDLLDLQGRPFALPLTKPRYAQVFGPDGQQLEQLFTAAYSEHPVWVQTPGLALLVGAAPNAGPFVLTACDGAAAEVDCAPPVLHAAAPLEGAYTRVRLPAGARAVFATPAGGGQRLAAAGNSQPGDSPAQQNMQQIDSAVIPALQKKTTDSIIGAQSFAGTEFAVSVLRPADLLNLDFEFENLKLQADGKGGSQLVRKTAGSPAYIKVHFPPQYIIEEAMLEQNGTFPNLKSPPVSSELAGPSRLVFALPNGAAPIPYTLEGLLNWSGLVLSVADTAKAPAGATNLPTVPAAGLNTPAANPAPSLPLPAHTAIEAPYRVILSPSKYNTWANATAPVKHGTVTELWHTRLAARSDDGPDEQRADLKSVRAIWSKDYVGSAVPAGNEYEPFYTSLTNDKRHYLVKATADFPTVGTPASLRASRLMLSALGAWFDLEGAWDFTAKDIPLVEYKHTATMGRDQYVRVVDAGYLFPFRHKARQVQISQRKFIDKETPRGTQRVAYLTKKTYIVVDQREVEYSDVQAIGFLKGGREFPFRKVRIVEKQSPDLDPPAGIANLGTGAYWPKVGGTPLSWHLEGEDVAGNQIKFTAPLAWISTAHAHSGASLTKVIESYADGLRKRDLNGQRLHYAPPSQAGDTEFETKTIEFSAKVPSANGNGAAGSVYFFPTCEGAEVRINEIVHLTKTGASEQAIKPATAYLNDGFGANNPGQVFLELKTAQPIALSGELGGGVATPKMTLRAVARTVGLVAGTVSSFAAGSSSFNLRDFLDNDSQLFGGIKLKDVIKTDGAATFSQKLERVPKIRSRVIRSGNRDKSVETALTWQTPLTQTGEIVKFEPAGGSALNSEVKLTSALDGSGSTYKVKNAVGPFTLHIADMIHIAFRDFSTVMETGHKPVVNTQITDVSFSGCLSWVTNLTGFLKQLGLGSSTLEATSVGLAMRTAIGPLNIQLGMLSISNIYLMTQLTVPFTGSSALGFTFDFGTPDAPAQVAVGFLGGGAYFGLAFTGKGLTKVAAAFEFGGVVALDIGVATGKVEIMAGVYFEIVAGVVKLRGYLRCSGCVRVIKLITISCVFYLALEYDDGTGKVMGYAEVTVTVEIAFLSKDVTMRLKREFPGHAGDPTFADMYTNAQWLEYCESFA